MTTHRLLIATTALCLTTLFAGCEQHEAPAEEVSSPSVAGVADAAQAGATSNTPAGDDSQTETELDEHGADAGAPADQPLEPWRTDLLASAFDAVSGMPLNPHIDNRARGQMKVVEACLELNQPVRALEYIEHIPNWLKGQGYADYAYYSARHDFVDETHTFIALADEIAENPATIDWQRDRIRVKIAKSYLWLQDNEQANAYAEGAQMEEASRLTEVRMDRIDASLIEEQMGELDQAIRTGSLEVQHRALKGYVRLFDRLYDDAESRSKIESTVYSSSIDLPAVMQVEVVLDLADVAVAHEDPDKVKMLLRVAKERTGGLRLAPELQVRVLARMAGLEHASGDTEAAVEITLDALEYFDAEEHRITNIFRGRALQPIAETLAKMGRRDSAHEVYRMIIEEYASISGNSRPCADTLSHACCSMAVHGVRPSDELMARILEIRDGLGDPW
jgi:tetratricopeptide (TPR) repeat protein